MGALPKPEVTHPLSLAAKLRERIAREGPISVHDYMAACLSDRSSGYYATRQPIGGAGDFITAPEISQIFGELIGVWIVAVWHRMGGPASLTVAELGPGRGTLMEDALRAWRSTPEFLASVSVALIETSPALAAVQREALHDAPAPLHWHQTLATVPRGPLILVANEFIDALPVRQYVRQDGVWHERTVTLDSQDRFAFATGAAALPDAVATAFRDRDLDDGEIIETRPAAADIIKALAARAEDAPVAALIADYGHAESGTGDTLQAVHRHRFADPLASPGEIDLTAHVDFAALSAAARDSGLVAFGPMPQGEFLLKLGLASRSERLIDKARPDQKQAILSGAARLADPRQMGVLFKMLALQTPGLAPPPPFADTAPGSA
jgi:NADH dehydrogenase [ubiquinone] 1 alpha subcomplex assembly factor 7